jgi:hypothetical protein
MESRLNEVFGNHLDQKPLFELDGIERKRDDLFCHNYHFRLGDLVEVVSSFKATEQALVGQSAMFLGYTRPHRFAKIAVFNDNFDFTAIWLLHPEQIELFGVSTIVRREVVFSDLQNFADRTGLLDREGILKLRDSYPELPLPEDPDNDSGGYCCVKQKTELMNFCAMNPDFHIITEDDQHNMDNRIRLVNRLRYFLAKGGDRNLNISYNAEGARDPDAFLESIIFDYDEDRHLIPKGFGNFLLQKYLIRYPEFQKQLADHEVFCAVEENTPDAEMAASTSAEVSEKRRHAVKKS